MPFSFFDLQTVFSSTAIDLAHGLLAANAVRSLQQRDGGKVITAIVAAGEEDKSFRVYVRDSGHGQIHSECSCGRSPACEHAAAALLAVLRLEHDSSDHASAEVQVKPPKTDTAIATDQQLLYILNPESKVNTGLPVDTVVVRNIRHGVYSGGSRFSPERADKNNPARFLQPEDFEILADLARMQCGKEAHSVIDGADSERLLQTIMQTGRCHMADNYSHPIKIAEPRPLSLNWITDQSGIQHLQWQIIPAAEYVLVLPHPWYIDQSHHVAGKLTSDLPLALLKALLAQPTLDPAQAEQTKTRIKTDFPHVHLPQLRTYETKTVSAAPVACLRLFCMQEESGLEHKNAVHRAELFFTYDGVVVNIHTPATCFDGHSLIRVQRDTKFEQQCKRRLSKAGFYSVPRSDMSDKDVYGLPGDPANWIDFQYDVLPLLSEDNWTILYDPSFQLRAVRNQSWYCDTRRLEDKDWFEFTIGVVIDGERINLLPVLLDFLRRHPPETPQDPHKRYHVLQIQDGQWLRVPAERIRAILNSLVSLYTAKSTKVPPMSLRLPLYQLANISELALAKSAPISDWLGDDPLRSLAESLRHAGQATSVSAPQTLQTQLRHYQQSGLNWLQFLREQHMGGILADDMGLGKTVQTIAHLLVEKQHSRMDRPSLIVAPTSLVFNWRNELRKFAPSLRCLCLHGPNRQQRFQSIGQYDVVITTYPLLIRDEPALRAFNYHCLILDEAHYIKNPKTKAARCVRKLDARHKLCLTGTPLENHLGELWSLYDFLLPGLLGSEKQFQAGFRTPIEKHQDVSRIELLARRVRPFMLRRTKDEVAGELPQKTEIVRRIALTQPQQDLYETVRLSVHHHVLSVIQHQGLARSQITILEALLKLRQVCCDPRLVRLDQPHGVSDSAKLEFLCEILPEMIEEGRRILLFSQFTSMLALIEEEVQKMHIDYAKLTGQTTDRAAQIERFQAREVPLFLISLKAGGVGLNLTAADTVIHYDPWWNPAVERQATDRAHRIGQTQRVFVYKLICEGTVEEKILSLQEHKQSLADGLFRLQEPGTARWSEQEIEELLAPLE